MRPTLPDLPTFCRPPFRACPFTSKIWGVNEFGGETMVADMRGWGYLTGKSYALALDDATARAAQHKTAEFIAAAMNTAFSKWEDEQ